MSASIDAEKIINYRETRSEDGPAVFDLVGRCSPLDLNSRYHYLLLARQFADTCIVAEERGALVGYVSAYVHPRQTDTLFVWQVAVDPAVRGRGVGVGMLGELLARPALRRLAWLETTIGPSNAASRGMFLSLARRLGAGVEECVYFPAQAFGPEGHEAEMLWRIGPLCGGIDEKEK